MFVNDMGIPKINYVFKICMVMLLVLGVAGSAALVLAPPVHAEGAAMPIVNDIKVSGLNRIDESVVLERISQRPGQPISTEGITADIHTLFQTGYFEDVQVDVEPLEGGVVLTYKLEEKPTIRRVEVYGNDIVEDEYIDDVITISPGAVADMALIQDNVRSIVGLYQKKRYPLVQVVPVLRKISEGHVLLTFQIDEGLRVKIDDIIIIGNEAVSGYRYRKVMKTREWWMFAPITGAGKYRQEVLEEDLVRLSDYLHNNGYIKNEISEPEITYKKNSKWMDITIHVKEGSQFTVGALGFEGNELYTDEELLEELALTPGEVMSKKVLRADVEKISDKITSQGYALASVYPDIKPNDETLETDVTFRIREGDIYTVGRIDVMGNVKTHDKVIRREIRLSEGEQYDGKKLKRSFQMLSNLNYFGDIDLEPSPDPQTKVMRLGVKVVEKPTGSFNIGAGYSSVEQFVGMVDVTFGNFRGAGQTLKLSAEFSSDSTTYSVEFKEPWLFDRPIEFSAKVFKSEKEYDEYTKMSTGFSLGLSRRFKEYWKIGSTYTYRLDEVYDVDDDASDAVLDLPEESILSSMSPFISRDTRDNFLNPHRGSKNTLAFSYAGLGGDNYFLKASLDSAWILPISKQTEFSMRGRYGYATGLYGYELPLYEKYYVGGPYTIRGMRKIGPHDEDGDYIGGRQRLLFNFDYTFPLIKDAGLKGDLFFDTGTAFDGSDTLDMRKTAGVGFRWITPIGPLMFFYAKNLDRKENEQDHRWEFAIGALF